MSEHDTQEKSPLTDFGYEKVSPKEKTRKVAEVFHSVASKYDLMNDLMSLGTHRLWKHFTINLTNVRAGQTVLDVAAGTADLSKSFAKKVGPNGQVIVTDINDSMLKVGRTRLEDAGHISNVRYVQMNAEALAFPNNSFDLITIAFGLRNVTDKAKALRSMYQAVKPGGQLIVLEFSKPTVPGLDKVYDAYSFKLLPKIGKWVAKDEDSYRYLAESIRMHPDQDTLKSMVLAAGFDECKVHNLSGGIVAVHQAKKF